MLFHHFLTIPGGGARRLPVGFARRACFLGRQIDEHHAQPLARATEQREEAQALRLLAAQPGGQVSRGQRLVADVDGVERYPVADAQFEAIERLIFMPIRSKG